MQKNYRHGRPTLGVLAGWQMYEGSLHSFLESILQGIRSAAREHGCHLLLACGHASGGVSVRPAWPVHLPGDESDFVPVGPWNTDGLLVVTPLHRLSLSCPGLKNSVTPLKGRCL